jgi:hypothetical protein
VFTSDSWSAGTLRTADAPGAADAAATGAALALATGAGETERSLLAQ